MAQGHQSQNPRTRYARSGDIDIAYQVLGDGPVDLLVLPGPSIPIDSIDDEPSMHRFYRRLSSFSRVIRLDFRGTGLSSNIPSREMLGPRYWAEDALAVLGAVGRQVLFLAASYFAVTGAVIVVAL